MLLANEAGFTRRTYLRICDTNMPILEEVRQFEPDGKPSVIIGLLPRDSINLAVSLKVYHSINTDLAKEENDARRISSLTIDRTFVYLDISDFSKHSPAQQAVVINSLISIVHSQSLWSTGYPAQLPTEIEAMLCIGDGYIFVFDDATKGTFFGAYLATLIDVMMAKKRLPVDFHFRMGVHSGPVYTFWDPGRGDWNYIGKGIIGGNRVLNAVGKAFDDVMYVSDEVRHWIISNDTGDYPNPAILENLHNRGRKEDKHRNPWRVYELSHTALCRQWLPPELRKYS